MINPCKRCGGLLALDVDGVYLEEERVCLGCGRRYDRKFNLLSGEPDLSKFLKKHGFEGDGHKAFHRSKRYRVRS